MKYKIRQANDGDVFTIKSVTRAAFKGKPYADGNEGTLAEKLHANSALVLSLVAVEHRHVVGHVALSPAKIGDQKCLALGPLAVQPDKQGHGVGSALVNYAVAVAGAYGRGGVVLMGDPAFYGRLGFKVPKGVTYQGKPSKHVQIIGFDDTPSGDVKFHPVFSE